MYSGFLYADMIVLSHGHNVAPVRVEARIKKEVPFLSNIMLVGDGRGYICCLVTLKVSIDIICILSICVYRDICSRIYSALKSSTMKLAVYHQLRFAWTYC